MRFCAAKVNKLKAFYSVQHKMLLPFVRKKVIVAKIKLCSARIHSHNKSPVDLFHKIISPNVLFCNR